MLLVLVINIKVANAQTELQKDSVSQTEISKPEQAYKVFYDETPVKGDYDKPPVYHEFKVIGGVIYAVSGTTDFADSKQPFSYGNNLMLNVCFITNKTYHNVAYGIANNTLKVVNGFPFGTKNLDVYVTPGINLASGVMCLAAGIEKVIPAGDVKFFIFSEVGKEFKTESKLALTIGFHVNIQSVLHQRKGREIFYQ